MVIKMSNRRRKKTLKKTKIIISVIVLVSECLMFAAGYFTCAYSTKMAAGKTEAVSEEQKTGQDKTEKLVEKIMEDMTLGDMIYQMMFVTPEALTNVGTVIRAGDTTKKALEKYPVGGIVYFSQNFENRDQTVGMIKKTQEYSKIPLFIGVDEEGGRVSRVGSNPAMGTTKQPAMKSIGETGDVNKALEVGETLGKELSDLGFNVDFAPDADVVINENNTEIGDRSFGADPELTAEMVSKVVKGLEENGVSATLKHFPGHGSTVVDSHTGYSESVRTIEQIRETELLPFKAGIEAGADFVMISHVTLVNVTEEKVPSSVSGEIITDLLINELGYKGIVITDSFSMGAIIKEYNTADAVTKAVSAGADMILMPTDLNTAYTALLEAVENGVISEERIKKSVRKILTLKAEKQML